MLGDPCLLIALCLVLVFVAAGSWLVFSDIEILAFSDPKPLGNDPTHNVEESTAQNSILFWLAIGYVELPKDAPFEGTRATWLCPV